MSGIIHYPVFLCDVYRSPSRLILVFCCCVNKIFFRLRLLFLDRFTLEDRTNRLSRNVDYNYRSALPNVPEEWRFQVTFTCTLFIEKYYWYICMYIYIYIYIYIHRVSQEECARLRKAVPYVRVYRYNPKHLCPKLNGYGDNGQRSLKLWQLLHTCWLPNTY